MIIGFEEYTHELTDYEKRVILPKVHLMLKDRIGKRKAISNKTICNHFRAHGVKTSQPRIRKIVHYFRINGMIKLLMSNSKGYFIAETRTELINHVKSLRQRINSITDIADALELQANAKEFMNDQFKLL